MATLCNADADRMSNRQRDADDAADAGTNRRTANNVAVATVVGDTAAENTGYWWPLLLLLWR